MNKPLLMRPTGKDYLWGGQRLNTDFGKNIDLSPLAETWECSTHPDGPSFVVGGKFDGRSLADVIKEFPEYMGTKHKGETELPILIKFIDAKKDLSVQVHPDDDYAFEHENGQNGKTEMWYVLDATEDAKLVYGLNQDCTEEMMREAIEKGTLSNYLQTVPVDKGDLFFIEAGTIHAIGAGCLIAEIQENSNLTYRLYDYNRVDDKGNKRELHVDKAMAVSNLKHSAKPEKSIGADNLLTSCRYFEVYKMFLNSENEQTVTLHADKTGYRVLLCIEGGGTMTYDDENVNISKGDCVFIPADSVMISVHGDAQFLDVRG